MEMLYLIKNYLELEVIYHKGTVLVTPCRYCVELERSARVIALSEQLLATEYLQIHHSQAPLRDLEVYFEDKGWQVAKVH